MEFAIERLKLEPCEVLIHRISVGKMEFAIGRLKSITLDSQANSFISVGKKEFAIVRLKYGILNGTEIMAVFEWERRNSRLGD